MGSDKKLVLEPEGWECTFKECRPGLFAYDGGVGLKTEYGNEGFCESGETFCSDDTKVIPVKSVWHDD